MDLIERDSDALPALPDIERAGLFVDSWLAQQQSERTRQAYADALERFAVWAGLARDEAAHAYLRASNGRATFLLNDWRSAMADSYSASTIRQRIAALRSLAKYARQTTGHGPRPEPKLPPLGKPYKAALALSVADVKALERAASGKTPKAIRDRALLALLFRMGLRRAEVASLRIEDIDTRAGCVSPLRKGFADREPIFPGAAVMTRLSDWLAVRPAIASDALFVSCHRRGARPLDARGVYDAVKQMGASVGIAVTPHLFRHTAATALLKSGAPVADVSTFLNHANVATTSAYLRRAKNAPGEAAEALTALLEG